MVASRVALGVNNYTSDTTTFLIDHPTGGWVEGDILVFSVTTASSTPRTFTFRQGTTALSKVDLFGPVTNSSSYGLAAYHIITSGGAFQFNVLLDGASQGTVAWQVLRGVDLNDPVNVSVISTSSGSTPHTLPSMTTTKDDCLITGGIFQGSGSAVWTAPSPWVIDVDGTRRNGILTHKGLQSTAGATGSSSWVMPDGPNANAQIYQIAWNSAEPPAPPIEATLMSEPFPGASGDVADGAAIIPDPSTPGNSVVLATNKDASGGLYVLDMDGEILSSVTGFAANSVDWRDTTGLSGWDGRILVMTCDRNSGSYALRFFWFNRTTRALTSAGTIPVLNEPYGTCLGISGGTLYAYMTERGPDDTSPREFYQASLVRSGDTVSLGSIVRQFTLPSVVEGMTVADDHNALFMSQEDVGLFALDARAGGGNWDTRLTVDLVGGGNLVADVEDVAVAYTANGPRVLVSSQGDNSYHVYYWDEVEEQYVHEQRFTIARPSGGGQVTGTDGLDVCIANLGPTFPNGLIAVHDDGLDPSRFAFVDAALVFGEVAIPEGGFAAAYAWGPATAEGERDSEGGFTASIAFGPAVAEGEASAEGDFAASVAWGPAEASGGAQPEGDFAASISFGPAVAEGASDPQGGFASTLAWGPAEASGQAAAEGGFSTSLTFGPAAAEGAADYSGGFATSIAWGPAEASGAGSAAGDFVSSYAWGPAEAAGQADHSGGFEGAYAWGPATASGQGDAAGDFATAYTWGPADASGASQPLGEFAASIAWGPAEASGESASGGDFAATVGWGPAAASGERSSVASFGASWSWGPAGFTAPDTAECWPDMLLVPEGAGITLVPEGVGWILVEDGCAP